MTSPVRTERLSKTYDVRTRKGLFKSEKRSVEALKSITRIVCQLFPLLSLATIHLKYFALYPPGLCRRCLPLDHDGLPGGFP